MNDNLTEIAFVLDRSGSMDGMAAAAIDGFNEFLRDQQQAEGDARLTLVLFDDQYEVPFASIPVAEATCLDGETYVPRGMTALLDAVGRTIRQLGKQLAATPEHDRPGRVIVAILTDGLENASRRYGPRKIVEMIRHQEETYAWEFLFLGANQDAIATAAKMGIRKESAASYASDAIGHKAVSKAISRKMSAMRRTSGTDADRQRPMEDILREEDGRDL